MNAPFFSILIPVYNVENYLTQCLNSVLKQSYINFEVILMNDGSTDSSGYICDEFAKKDSRIKVFHEENSGLLITRRKSLRIAKGEYILFLDSDDYWQEDALVTIYKKLVENNVDILIFGYNRVDEYGNILSISNDLFCDNEIFTIKNKELLFKKLLTTYELNNIWIKALRREIIDVDKDYSQFRDKKGEDLLQTLPVFESASTIMYINKKLYNYRMSITGRGRNFKVKYFEDLNVVRNVLHEYLVKLHYDSEENLSKFYHQYVSTIIRYSMAFSYNNTDFKEAYQVLKVQVNQPIFIDAQKYISYNQFSFSEKIYYHFMKNNQISSIIFALSFRKLVRNAFITAKKNLKGERNKMGNVKN